MGTEGGVQAHTQGNTSYAIRGRLLAVDQVEKTNQLTQTWLASSAWRIVQSRPRLRFLDIAT